MTFSGQKKPGGEGEGIEFHTQSMHTAQLVLAGQGVNGSNESKMTLNETNQNNYK